MSRPIDSTHDRSLKSWVESANDPANDFPIQNLPFGRFRTASGHPHIGVAIGDSIVDLERAGLATGDDMNALLASGALGTLRQSLSASLRRGSANRPALERALVPAADVSLELPCRVGDYTDFYASVHHATTVGKQFRPDNPLLPNYKWVPIGYHGRASSIVASGHAFPRPNGQRMPPEATTPVVGPSRRLDYELELGIVVGRGNAIGDAVPLVEAEAHIAGLVLLNDWSARDIQGWEYQPLGPFLAKNFATTVSPWIVTLEALAPFRAAFQRPDSDPAPLPYLDSPANRETGAIDIALEVWLQTARMREQDHPGDRISTSNYREAAYWTMAQLLTHHTIGGCNLQPGDLMGSGTMSGPRPEEAGSLLELTAAGKKPLTLSNGETRGFLEDGDTVILRAHCERDGFRRIGFGECRGTVLPARAMPR